MPVAHTLLYTSAIILNEFSVQLEDLLCLNPLTPLLPSCFLWPYISSSLRKSHLVTSHEPKYSFLTHQIQRAHFKLPVSFTSGSLVQLPELQLMLALIKISHPLTLPLFFRRGSALNPVLTSDCSDLCLNSDFMVHHYNNDLENTFNPLMLFSIILTWQSPNSSFSCIAKLGWLQSHTGWTDSVFY